MKQIIVVLTSVAAVALAGWWLFVSRPEGPVVSLIDLLPEAEKRSTLDPSEAFAVVEATLAGETRRGIRSQATSRIRFLAVTLPEDAWLHVAIGIEEAAWNAPQSDGALFRFGVSDGREYEELVVQHLDPVRNPADRRWVPLAIDLSRYGGEQVDLVFNVNASPPGADNRELDLAVWGDPEIRTRR